jgi:hypothetical protein
MSDRKSSSRSGSSNTAHSLIDRSGCLRQQARKYREIYDKDYPLHDNTTTMNNATNINKQLDDLKNMIRRTNLQYDNIRPIFISLGIIKKKKK